MSMLKAASLVVLMACGSAAASGTICKRGVYIVGMSSVRQYEDDTEHMGWAIMVSQKPYFDQSAEFQRTDKGRRIDINTSRGKVTLDLAMYAMNMRYKVDVVDNNGTRCDDFDELDVKRMPSQ